MNLYDPSLVYSLDIETSTAPCPTHRRSCGLDPTCARVTDISVGGDTFGFVISDDDEVTMLGRLSALLKFLPDGIVTTWNGAVFDLPYLNTRYAIAGMASPFTLVADPSVPVKYAPTPGYAGGCRAKIGRHLHADISAAYRPIAAARQIRHSLKPVAAAVLGQRPVVEDRRALHLIDRTRRREYALSDAVITRDLALALGERLLGETDFHPRLAA